MRKKAYTKPRIEINEIDNEISLVMMTDEYTPPDKPGPPSASQVAPESESSPTQLNSFEDNPFGD